MAKKQHISRNIRIFPTDSMVGMDNLGDAHRLADYPYIAVVAPLLLVNEDTIRPAPYSPLAAEVILDAVDFTRKHRLDTYAKAMQLLHVKSTEDELRESLEARLKTYENKPYDVLSKLTALEADVTAYQYSIEQHQANTGRLERMLRTMPDELTLLNHDGMDLFIQYGPQLPRTTHDIFRLTTFEQDGKHISEYGKCNRYLHCITLKDGFLLPHVRHEVTHMVAHLLNDMDRHPQYLKDVEADLLKDANSPAWEKLGKVNRDFRTHGYKVAGYPAELLVEMREVWTQTVENHRGFGLEQAAAEKLADNDLAESFPNSHRWHNNYNKSLKIVAEKLRQQESWEVSGQPTRQTRRDV